MADTIEPNSPEWWLRRLTKELLDRRKRYELYDDYYEGRHPLAFASPKFRKAFGGHFEEFADNWCDLVVDAVEERLNVEGFRIPVEGGENTAAADKDATDMWQRAEMDAHSQMLHSEALINGEASVLVWADADGEPEITVEHPSQMIVAYDPESTQRRAAALKLWSDDDGMQFATLYLPSEIYKWEANRRFRSSWPGISRWDRREIASEAWPLPNPLEEVPVVPFENRPRMLVAGRSEIAKVIPVQDGINKLVADMLIASEFGSFRQRWVTGMEIPTDPENGEPVEPFKVAVDRLWMVEDPDAKFGEFGETNLANFVGAIEMLVQHVASQTRTPPHYFYLRGEFPSGESIKSAETGLVAKTRRKMRHFGQRHEAVIRLGFKVKRDPRANAIGIETIWSDPESRTEGEHVDAALKKQTLGVPWEQIMEDLGYTPKQIERMRAMRQREALEVATAFDPFAGAPGAPQPQPNGAGGAA